MAAFREKRASEAEEEVDRVTRCLIEVEGEMEEKSKLLMEADNRCALLEGDYERVYAEATSLKEECDLLNKRIHNIQLKSRKREKKKMKGEGEDEVNEVSGAEDDETISESTPSPLYRKFCGVEVSKLTPNKQSPDSKNGGAKRLMSRLSKAELVTEVLRLRNEVDELSAQHDRGSGERVEATKSPNSDRPAPSPHSVRCAVLIDTATQYDCEGEWEINTVNLHQPDSPQFKQTGEGRKKGEHQSEPTACRCECFCDCYCSSCESRHLRLIAQQRNSLSSYGSLTSFMSKTNQTRRASLPPNGHIEKDGELHLLTHLTQQPNDATHSNNGRQVWASCRPSTALQSDDGVRLSTDPTSLNPTSVISTERRARFAPQFAIPTLHLTRLAQQPRISALNTIRQASALGLDGSVDGLDAVRLSKAFQSSLRAHRSRDGLMSLSLQTGSTLRGCGLQCHSTTHRPSKAPDEQIFLHSLNQPLSRVMQSSTQTTLPQSNTQRSLNLPHPHLPHSLNFNTAPRCTSLLRSTTTTQSNPVSRNSSPTRMNGESHHLWGVAEGRGDTDITTLAAGVELPPLNSPYSDLARPGELLRSPTASPVQRCDNRQPLSPLAEGREGGSEVRRSLSEVRRSYSEVNSRMISGSIEDCFGSDDRLNHLSHLTHASNTHLTDLVTHSPALIERCDLIGDEHLQSGESELRQDGSHMCQLYGEGSGVINDEEGLVYEDDGEDDEIYDSLNAPHSRNAPHSLNAPHSPNAPDSSDRCSSGAHQQHSLRTTQPLTLPLPPSSATPMHKTTIRSSLQLTPSPHHRPSTRQQQGQKSTTRRRPRAASAGMVEIARLVTEVGGGLMSRPQGNGAGGGDSRLAGICLEEELLIPRQDGEDIPSIRWPTDDDALWEHDEEAVAIRRFVDQMALRQYRLESQLISTNIDNEILQNHLKTCAWRIRSELIAERDAALRCLADEKERETRERDLLIEEMKKHDRAMQCRVRLASDRLKTVMVQVIPLLRLFSLNTDKQPSIRTTLNQPHPIDAAIAPLLQLLANPNTSHLINTSHLSHFPSSPQKSLPFSLLNPSPLHPTSLTTSPPPIPPLQGLPLPPTRYPRLESLSSRSSRHMLRPRNVKQLPTDFNCARRRSSGPPGPTSHHSTSHTAYYLPSLTSARRRSASTSANFVNGVHARGGPSSNRASRQTSCICDSEPHPTDTSRSSIGGTTSCLTSLTTWTDEERGLQQRRRREASLTRQSSSSSLREVSARQVSQSTLSVTEMKRSGHSGETQQSRETHGTFDTQLHASEEMRQGEIQRDRCDDGTRGTANRHTPPCQPRSSPPLKKDTNGTPEPASVPNPTSLKCVTTSLPSPSVSAVSGRISVASKSPTARAKAKQTSSSISLSYTPSMSGHTHHSHLSKRPASTPLKRRSFPLPTAKSPRQNDLTHSDSHRHTPSHRHALTKDAHRTLNHSTDTPFDAPHPTMSPTSVTAHRIKDKEPPSCISSGLPKPIHRKSKRSPSSDSLPSSLASPMPHTSLNAGAGKARPKQRKQRSNRFSSSATGEREGEYGDRGDE
eukprot:GHVN01089109.1.p1 GENE.GHVN01089109.1~~GHVN01089109.1.p1  ORF type:complete len:1658 (+),score=521.37 GHVN01089109.1:322-4974(+)